MNDYINKNEFFEALYSVGFRGAKGHKLLCEFTDELDAIPGGMYFGQFSKLAVFVDMMYGISSAKQIINRHVYELLDFLEKVGFKESTLKSYITSVRQVHKWNKELFSEDFVIPSNTDWEIWKSQTNLANKD